MDVVGRHGDHYKLTFAVTAREMAPTLRMAIRKEVAVNPDGYELDAPSEVIAALEAGPLTGRRISYYASAEAWNAIQAQREATGDSQSGAINALVLRQKQGY